MKKQFKAALLLAMASSLVLGGCQKKEEDDDEPVTPTVTTSIIDDMTNGRPNQVVGCVEIDTRVTSIEVWDNATVDGDIVTLYMNNDIKILDSYELQGPDNIKKISQNFPNNGVNSLTLYANNEGDIPPNTVTIRINGEDTFSISSNLNTNGAVHVVVNGYGVSCSDL